MAYHSRDNLIRSDSDTDHHQPPRLRPTRLPQPRQVLPSPASAGPPKPLRKSRQFTATDINQPPIYNAQHIASASVHHPVPMPRRNITVATVDKQVDTTSLSSTSPSPPFGQNTSVDAPDTVIEIEAPADRTTPNVRPMPRRLLPESQSTERAEEQLISVYPYPDPGGSVTTIFTREASASRRTAARKEESSSESAGDQRPVKLKRSQKKAQIPASKPPPPAPAAYRYEQLIGILLHRTSAMQFDYRVSTPMVRCSVLDARTGRPLAKSDARRSAVLANEPAEVDFVQPVLSAACRFREDTEYIECEWNEMLLVNEDVRHVQTGGEVVMFELVAAQSRERCDFLNIAMADGWQYLCWAFLRPGDGQSVSYLDRRCRLQLYKYSLPQKRRLRRPQPPDVFAEWQSTARRKYPATIDVTLKAIRQPADQRSVARSPPQLRRPQNALQCDRRAELTEKQKIFTASPPSLPPPAHPPLISEIDQQRWHRAIGQPCRVPNKLVARLPLDVQSRGSLASRFSPDGRLLAVAQAPSVPHQPHDILILRVNDTQLVLRLSAHTGLVYGLEWRCLRSAVSDRDAPPLLLLSVSADRMAIVWRIDRTHNTFDYAVLPHPCFVYAGRFLDNQPGQWRRSGAELGGDGPVLCVTGGRDAVLRVWSLTGAKGASAALVQELQGRAGAGDYITSVVAAVASVASLFSADSSGTICEWQRVPQGSATTGRVYQEEARIITEMGDCVRQMQLNRYEDMLYVMLLRDGGQKSSSAAVVSLSVHTGQRLRSFELGSASMAKPACFALSECGSLLLTVGADARVQGWSMLDGSEEDVDGRREPFVLAELQKQWRCDGGGYVSSLDCCRRSHLSSLTVFGGRGAAGARGGGAHTVGVFMLGWMEARKTEMRSPMEKPIEMVRGQEERLQDVDRQQQQDLDGIIRRLDRIFSLPQNKTDDLKSARVEKDVGEEEDGEEMQVMGSDAVSRSGTFVIRQRSHPSNHTFVVSRSFAAGDGGDETTTVSESL